MRDWGGVPVLVTGADPPSLERSIINAFGGKSVKSLTFFFKMAIIGI